MVTYFKEENILYMHPPKVKGSKDIHENVKGLIYMEQTTVNTIIVFAMGLLPNTFTCARDCRQK